MQIKGIPRFKDLIKRSVYRSSSPTVYVDAWFGQSNGTSLNIEPDCKGSELDLAFCRLKNEWGNQSCSHSDDAGVSCTPTALGKSYILL